MTTVRDILTAHLRSLGAAGLCSAEFECGCGLGDLAPCETGCIDCKPARVGVATEDGDTYDKGDKIFLLL